MAFKRDFKFPRGWLSTIGGLFNRPGKKSKIAITREEFTLIAEVAIESVSADAGTETDPFRKFIHVLKTARILSKKGTKRRKQFPEILRIAKKLTKVMPREKIEFIYNVARKASSIQKFGAIMEQSLEKPFQHEMRGGNSSRYRIIDTPEEVDDIILELNELKDEPDNPRTIALFEKVLSIVDRDAYPDAWQFISHLFGRVLMENTVNDRGENIEKAIDHYKAALELNSVEVSPVIWVQVKKDLAAAYRVRIYGSPVENTEKAIQIYKETLEAVRPEVIPWEWSEIMKGLAFIYAERKHGDPSENLEKSIQYCKEALKVVKRDTMPYEWASIKMTMGFTYGNRIREDKWENTEHAIKCIKQALEIITHDTQPVNWGRGMMNMGKVYLQRGSEDDMEHAIQCFEQVLDVITRDSDPEMWSQTMVFLGDTYHSPWGDHENVDKALECYRNALNVKTMHGWTFEYMDVQGAIGDLCYHRGMQKEVIEAYTSVLEAGEILHKAAVLPEFRQTELSRLWNVPNRLASELATSGKPDDIKKAVVLLEKHHARWLSESLSLKSGKPEAVPEAVWNRFDKCRREYNKLLMKSRMPSGDRGRPEALELSAAIRKASEVLDMELSSVREHDPTFMPDPDFNQIRSVLSSTNEAIVYIVVSRIGSDALVVRPDDENVTRIQLNFSEADLEFMVQHPGRPIIRDYDDYFDIYKTWRNTKSTKSRDDWFNILDFTTNKLGKLLMGQLTKGLIRLGITHAILIPQGLLALFPLHAAWTKENGKRRYVMDDVCYTYAPNALSLITSRNIARQTTPDRLMAIEDPTCSLAHSNQEVTAVCNHFSNPTSLYEELATRTAVRKAMPDHDVFHFACHGLSNFSEPLDSGLIMANNETLSLRDFLSTEGIRARLAVLSACETGIPDLKNADEVIGLPAGLVQAGVAGVAASLWATNDLSSMLIMVRFYELWRTDNLEPAEALRQAQIWVRDTDNGQKAAYFKGFLPESGKSDSQGLPVHLADELYKKFVFADRNKYKFEHPYYWAAFTFTGV